MKIEKIGPEGRPPGERCPDESQAIKVNGQRLNYLRAGSGPAVLLLHGLLAGSFCWRFNVEALSQKHTVLEVVLPGLGQNDAPRRTDCGMQAQAQRLSSMLEQLRLESVDV